MPTWYLILASLGGLVHAIIVVVGIYVALNARLTRLEVKMEVVWNHLLTQLKRITDASQGLKSG